MPRIERKKRRKKKRKNLPSHGNKLWKYLPDHINYCLNNHFDIRLNFNIQSTLTEQALNNIVSDIVTSLYQSKKDGFTIEQRKIFHDIFFSAQNLSTPESRKKIVVSPVAQVDQEKLSKFIKRHNLMDLWKQKKDRFKNRTLAIRMFYCTSIIITLTPPALLWLTHPSILLRNIFFSFPELMIITAIADYCRQPYNQKIYVLNGDDSNNSDLYFWSPLFIVSVVEITWFSYSVRNLAENRPDLLKNYLSLIASILFLAIFLYSIIKWNRCLESAPKKVEPLRGNTLTHFSKKKKLPRHSFPPTLEKIEEVENEEADHLELYLNASL